MEGYEADADSYLIPFCQTKKSKEMRNKIK